jgi:hypothetical protein
MVLSNKRSRKWRQRGRRVQRRLKEGKERLNTSGTPPGESGRERESEMFPLFADRVFLFGYYREYDPMYDWC